MTDLVIDVHHLTKKFGKRIVVNNIDIQLPKGRICGFLGPNGSGKTTTMRMLCGLLTPDRGEGTCLGYDILKQTDIIRKKIGYMTQKFSFWEDLTIQENLTFIANIYGMDNIKQRVDKSLKKLGLEDRKNQLAGSLSGGWKQRLALAACILHEPEVLLLDEPTAGVDPKARREFWVEINRLSKEGLTFLVSTHYMDEVVWCHRIVYIVHGNIMTQGTIDQVIKSTNLKTINISGNNIAELRLELENKPDIKTMALFGENLHICGTDIEKMKKILAKVKNKYGLTYTEVQTSLEDTFIYYINKAKEN